MSEANASQESHEGSLKQANIQACVRSDHTFLHSRMVVVHRVSEAIRGTVLLGSRHDEVAARLTTRTILIICLV